MFVIVITRCPPQDRRLHAVGSVLQLEDLREVDNDDVHNSSNDNNDSSNDSNNSKW